MVPLVAVDELPDWLGLVGVPRELTAEQTIDLYNLGTVSKSDGSYVVNMHQATAGGPSTTMEHTEGKQGDATVKAHSASSETKGSSPAAPGTTPAHPADNMKAHWNGAHARDLTINNNTAQHQPPTPLLPPGPQLTLPRGPTQPTGSTTSTASNTTTEPVTTTAATTTTEYCRHWCQHGTCRWGLRCRHLHAMPTTRAELAEVGLREIPAWWRIATATATAALPPTPPVSPSGSTITTQQHSSLGHLAGSNGSTSGGYDPRDVRAGLGVMRLLSPGAPGARTGTGTGDGLGVGVGLGRGSNSSNKRAAKAQMQLRETVALLRELDLALRGGAAKSARNKREVNPLDKGRGKGVVGEEKEALLQAAKVGGGLAASIHSPGPAAGVAAGGGGQVQTAGVIAARENAPGDHDKKQDGGRVAAAPKVGRLVDM
ncbi:hypothetical protein C8A03DRAFT_33981 [Achaetomium macrosporum]|uniref:C3H1-type domain-containing protein n=1 Tax=Achaetomium macrosporum TaxID=79813 RepID=A0AAN7HF99_9PEZI|nr:hypothetical protein C8A03DRAFT_33981 [Achaetomium macrosporum]